MYMYVNWHIKQLQYNEENGTYREKKLAETYLRYQQLPWLHTRTYMYMLTYTRTYYNVSLYMYTITAAVPCQICASALLCRTSMTDHKSASVGSF